MKKLEQPDYMEYNIIWEEIGIDWFIDEDTLNELLEKYQTKKES